MKFEIDHLLQIVENEEEAYRIAASTGLNVFTKTIHKGQGTSGIFFMFEECYFEFIWPRDLKEAKSNILRFDKKFEAVQKGGSPFGVALRANITKESESQIGLENFTKYNPAYGAYTIYFANESMADPALPLLFLMSHPERPNTSDWHPIKSDGRNHDLCNFKSNIKRYDSVRLHGPNIPTHKFPCTQFVKSDTHKMLIDSGTEFKFSEIVQLF